jgi:hypothetical protein
LTRQAGRNHIQVDLRDITATIVDLAVAGHLTIEGAALLA